MDTGDPPFVGRGRELKRLEEIWDLVERGERQAVFLGGEPGSGKSRISAELARSLHARDVVVMLGSSSPEPNYPYEPLTQALEQMLVSSEPGALTDLIPDSASDLMRFTPSIRRHRPDFDEPGPSDKEYRRELFSAYADLLCRLAAERPVALFVEDLHWSSAPTRHLISHLIETLPNQPLLVMATMRTTAPDRSAELSYAIADLYRYPGVTRIDLSGLDLEEIKTYLEMDKRGGMGHTRETAVLLKDLTGGNPLFLREMWREISDGGGFQALREGRIKAPQSVQGMLERRVRSFDPPVTTVLEHAATIGVAFHPSDLIDALGDSTEELLDALDLAAESGLIESTAPDVYIFKHALVRQALLDGMSPSRVAHTHARLAKSIESRYHPDSGLAPLLARLYGTAITLGHGDRTIHYLKKAAEGAQKALAYEEAAEFWEQAARIVAEDWGQREEMLLAAARSRLLGGDFPDARRIYRELTDSSSPETALRAAIGFEDATWRPGGVGHDARNLLESAIEGVNADPSDPLYVCALIAWGRSHVFTGNTQEAHRKVDKAIGYAREIGDAQLLADALVVKLLAVMTRPDIDDLNLKTAVELRSIVIRGGDYDRLGPAAVYRSRTGYLKGDITAWREGWGDLKLTVQKTGQPLWTWVDGCFQFCDEFMTGDWASASSTAERIKDLGYTFGTDDTEGPYGLQMYMVRRESGGLRQIRDLISGNPSADGTWLPGLTALYTELGMTDQVRATLPRVFEMVRNATDSTAVHPAIITFATEAALHLQDHPAIESLMPHLAEYDGLNLMVGHGVAIFGSANRYLGRMELALGNVEAAAEHFKKSLTMDVRIGSVVHQTETLAYYAKALELLGDGSMAGAYRDKARDLATSIGQTRVLDVLDRQGDPHLPDGLTSREVEVLGLLVRGASNKEIGQQLFISQNTVANHVRSILTKTGSANRTSAAIYASERNLV